MSVVVHCPKCRAKMRGPDDLPGRSVRCQSCREKFRVAGGDPASSPSDTQQLSVIVSSPAMPAVAVKTATVPAAISADTPLPLDDLILDQPPQPAIPRRKIESLDAADLLEEPKASSSADSFSFEDSVPAKKKKRRADADGDEEPRAKKRYHKKAGTPWGVIVGVGVALLVIGGGVTALVMSGGKKEDAKAKVETPPASVPEGRSKGKARGKEPAEANGGESKPEDGPKVPGAAGPQAEPKKKDLPPRKEPQRPAAVKLPDPPTGELAAVAPAKHRVALDFPADKVRDVRAAGPSLTVVFNSKPGFQGAGMTDTIRRYEIAGGAKGREFEFDSGTLGWPRAFAVGETDGLVAVECGGPGKVSAFDFATGTTLFDKRNVFENLPGRVGPVAALALGANRKLFVVDQAGTVDVWDMSTRQRGASCPAPKRPAGGKSGAKASAANHGATVAVALGNQVWCVNSDGAALGKPVTLPDPAAVPLAVGSGGAGTDVAVAYRTAGGRYAVAAVHPIGGDVELNVLLPDGAAAPTAVSWAAATLVAVATGDSGFILDLEDRSATAYLKAVTGKVTLFPTGGQFWWLAADPADTTKSALRSVELPFDGYFDVAEKARADRTPAFLVPRADGLAR